MHDEHLVDVFMLGVLGVLLGDMNPINTPRACRERVRDLYTAQIPTVQRRKDVQLPLTSGEST